MLLTRPEDEENYIFSQCHLNTGLKTRHKMAEGKFNLVRIMGDIKLQRTDAQTSFDYFPLFKG